jgi:hypothetical protein
MAGDTVGTPGGARTSGMASPETRDPGAPAEPRFAWLTLFFAAWILFGLILLAYALTHGLAFDIGFSPYHVPFYLGVAALAGFLGRRVIRAVRRARSWREALPPGYGTLGAGLLVLVAWPIVDLGWREGIGRTPGLTDFLGPHRVLVPIGVALIAMAPLRAALRGAGPVRAGWPAALSGAFVFATIAAIGGFLPVSRPYLETPTNGPEDDSEIWVMNADGSRQTRLIEAADGVEYGLPVWSPDGTQIAYTKQTSPPQMVAVDDVEIWLASADGSNRRQLVGRAGRVSALRTPGSTSHRQRASRLPSRRGWMSISGGLGPTEPANRSG